MTFHSNPLKIREYLVAGLPVVSTPVPEVVPALVRDRVAARARRAGVVEGRVDLAGELADRFGDAALAERHERVEEIRGHVRGIASRW